MLAYINRKKLMILVYEKYQSSFDTAMKCAVECEHCAQACMGGEKMKQCVRYCLDCAKMCRTIATYMVRGSDFVSQATTADCGHMRYSKASHKRDKNEAIFLGLSRENCQRY